MPLYFSLLCFFFFNDTATTEIYTLSLHDALPISHHLARHLLDRAGAVDRAGGGDARSEEHTSELQSQSNLVCRLLLEKNRRAGRWLLHRVAVALDVRAAAGHLPDAQLHAAGARRARGVGARRRRGTRADLQPDHAPADGAGDRGVRDLPVPVGLERPAGRAGLRRWQPGRVPADGPARGAVRHPRAGVVPALGGRVRVAGGAADRVPVAPALLRARAAGRQREGLTGQHPGTSGADVLDEPVVGGLRGPGQVLRVDVHDPEGLRVALGPLEVVEQGPHEVAADVGPRLAGRLGGVDVVAEVVDPVLVVDHRAPVGAVDEAVVAACRTVLGDDDRETGALVG